MSEAAFVEPPLTTTEVRVIFVIWFLILIPWLPFMTLMGSGMAFDGGNTAGEWAFAGTAWAYPCLVAVAWFFRKRKPVLVWLPILPLLVLIISIYFPG